MNSILCIFICFCLHTHVIDIKNNFYETKFVVFYSLCFSIIMERTSSNLKSSRRIKAVFSLHVPLRKVTRDVCVNWVSHDSSQVDLKIFSEFFKKYSSSFSAGHRGYNRSPPNTLWNYCPVSEIFIPTLL